MMTQPGFEQETFKTLLEEHLARLNQADALQKMRARAWDHFLELGLPNKRTEEYRYIKLRQLLSQSYPLAEDREVELPSNWTSWIFPECQQSVLVFVNGHFRPHLSRTEALPSKVVISSLQDAFRTYSSFLNNQWTKWIKEEKDPFAALNGALHLNGAFCYVPPKTVVEAPIQILHIVHSQNPAMMLPRLQIFVGTQSQVSFVSTQRSEGTSSYFVNQVADLAIEEDAHVHYTQVHCQEQPAAWHFDAFRATLKRYAALKTVQATEGSATVRCDYRINLAGENAEALLNGVAMLSGKLEAHTHVFMDHQMPYCRSYQMFKNVLNDTSRSSFEGKIMVRQPAQKTEAFQLNNNLLLSDYAHADSKPNLEIFADDVKASHGATVGQLDEEQLFYMKTRGLAEEQAKSLLVYGFCEQVIDLMTVPSLREAISQRARSYLTRGKV